MEVVDPFAPTCQTDDQFHVEIPEHWGTPFSTSAAPTPAVVEQAVAVASAAPFGAEMSGRPIDRSVEPAAGVPGALPELSSTLNETELEAKHTEGFKSLLLAGAGGEISFEDLKSLQAMTDSLVQYPDRLTVLFNVVQQASKLATVVAVYNQLRKYAEEN